MKFYNSIGPNPKVVRMYMKEADLNIETIEVDLPSGENRQPDYMAKNPSGQCPALEMDDGTFLSEITAICEFLDETFGPTHLIGTTPQERAETRMWVRRIDLNIAEVLGNGFRFSEGLAIFKDRIRTIPHAADDLKLLAQERLTWLDGLLGDKKFICGDRFTLADILLFCFLEFGALVGQPLNLDNKNIARWYELVSLRTSAVA